jgi:hypothetical protein
MLIKELSIINVDSNTLNNNKIKLTIFIMFGFEIKKKKRERVLLCILIKCLSNMDFNMFFLLFQLYNFEFKLLNNF